ncbi:hypothetical protein JD969_03605 [Planctomycetota bacterium]|nr:hypothetical protein JD969_03605 [Planctomycetota bacterium]
MANKYFKRSRMSDEEFRLLVRLFVDEHHAKEIAARVGVNRNSVNRILLKLRRRIALACHEFVGVETCLVGEESGWRMSGIGVDDVWIMVKRRLNGGPVLPFALFRVEGRVHVVVLEGVDMIGWEMEYLSGLFGGGEQGVGRLNEIVDNVDMGDGQEVYRRVYPDGGGVGDAIYRLRDLGSLESFWDRARERFVRFRGMRDETFCLCLKESEYRHNHRNGDVYREILKMLRDQPLV